MDDRSFFSRYRVPLLIVFTLLVGILLGRWFFSGPASEPDDHAGHAADGTIWTCSMDPQVRMTEPGSCPICGMDLIPLRQLEGDHAAMEVHLSPAAQKLAGVRTAVVGEGAVERQVRLTGKVQPDERRVYSQAVHVPGRIEKLAVSYTGQSVREGQELAVIYSPELLTAQQELLQAYAMHEERPVLYDAARQKLRNWRISDHQIDAVIANGEPQERFSIHADVSGVVLEMNGALGDYVSRGDILYQIADLSKVWVLFDVYESDLPWVKPGVEVEFTVRSIPGETFKGTISFVDPVIDPGARAARARVEVPNPDGRLKPEMFVNGVVRGQRSGGTSEIVVPRSAILWTGERSVVYVAGEHGYQLRQVTLGPSLGDSTVISAGLSTGEEVVVKGAFSVDAAAQLEGKPSMMDPEGGPAMEGHQH